MGQEHSRFVGRREEGAELGVSLWEGVPREILWLVHSQVKLLLSSHSAALLHRPEELGEPEEVEQVSESADTDVARLVLSKHKV